MHNYTPGPWRCGQDGNPRVYGPDVQGEHSGLIATVHRSSCMTLIVSAPDLLVAARHLMAMIDPDGESTDIWCEDMRAAIDKALGP